MPEIKSLDDESQESFQISGHGSSRHTNGMIQSEKQTNLSQKVNLVISFFMYIF